MRNNRFFKEVRFAERLDQQIKDRERMLAQAMIKPMPMIDWDKFDFRVKDFSPGPLMVHKEDQQPVMRRHSDLGTYQLKAMLDAKLAANGKKLEITDIKKPSVFDDVTVYMDWLEKKGWYRLGSGHFSTVFANPKDRSKVIKVCRKANDDWPVYAQWCNTLKSNLGIRLYSFKKHRSFYVAVTERVETIGVNVYNGDKGYAIKEAIENYQYSKPKLVAETNMDAAVRNARIRYCQKNAPKVLPFIRLLQKHDMLNDLHNNNWGLREDGSVCIFDPVTRVPAKIKSKFSSERYRYRAKAA